MLSTLRTALAQRHSIVTWVGEVDVQRYGTCVRLRPEMREQYLRLHAAVWPEIEAMLRSANIRNYTIFVHDDLLFGYYEYVGEDHEADQARIADDPKTRSWWTLTDPCQEPMPGTPDGQQWAPMTEIWHLSG